MSKGILVTNGVDINNAQPLDFVLDSRLKGGLKIAKKLTVNPVTDMILDPDSGYYSQYSHGLGYVPAVIAFQDGVFGIGWQNSEDEFQPSASADATNVYYQTGSKSLLTVLIFGEKVSDT